MYVANGRNELYDLSYNKWILDSLKKRVMPRS